MSTTIRSLGQLQEETAGIENRRRELEEHRAKLRDEAIAAERSGKPTDGILSKILEVDNRIEILTGTLEQIAAEIPEAKRRAAAEHVATIVAGAEGIRDEARVVADAAGEAVRNLVSTSRELEAMSTQYTNAVAQASTIAQRAGVQEPQLANDLLLSVFPETPDRWTLSYYWTSLVAPTLGEMEQFATALAGAEYFNESREDTNNE